MGLIVGVGLVALGTAVYVMLLRLAVYRQKPWESAGLMAVGAAAAAAQFAERPSLVTGVGAACLFLYTSLFIYVMMIYARSPRSSLKAKVGESFPEVTVKDEDGSDVSVGKSDLRESSGPTGTLYVFYRGHW